MVVTRSPNSLLSRLDPWAPPIALMGVIFILSAQPYAFYDRARVWNRTGGVLGGATLSSTGFGMRAQLPHDSEREALLQRRAPGAQDADVGALGDLAQRL